MAPSTWNVGWHDPWQLLPSAADRMAIFSTAEQCKKQVLADWSWLGAKASESLLETAKKIKTREWTEDRHKIQRSMVRWVLLFSACVLYLWLRNILTCYSMRMASLSLCVRSVQLGEWVTQEGLL